LVKNLDSVVGIATGYGLDDRGVEFESWKGQEFSLLHLVQTVPGVTPSLLANGYWGLFPVGKGAGE
jgi:hypothetical protein